MALPLTIRATASLASRMLLKPSDTRGGWRKWVNDAPGASSGRARVVLPWGAEGASCDLAGMRGKLRKSSKA